MMARKNRLGAVRLSDIALMAALCLIAFGNLVLTPDLQAGLELDYLVIAFSAVAIIIIIRLPVTISTWYPWAVGILLVFTTLPGFLAGAISPYGEAKAVSFGIVLLVLFASAALAEPERSIRVAFTILAILAVSLSLVVIVFGVAAENGRVSILGLNPVGISRFVGVGVVFPALFVLSSRPRGLLLRASALAAVACSAAAIITTGSRGPFVAALAAVAVCVVLILRARRVRAIWMLLACLIGLAATLFANLTGDASVDFLGGRGDSGRNVLYDAAIESIMRSPLGLGWGNYGAIFGFPSGEVLYPHNVYLEFAVEGGVVALLGFGVLSVAVLIVGARSYLRNSNPVALSVLALYIYALVNAQFSSDIVGNRMLWVSIALVLVHAKSTKNGVVETTPIRQEVR